MIKFAGGPVLQLSSIRNFNSCLAGSHPFITYLTTLCKNERLDEAIHAVELIDGQGAPISRDIIYCLLQGCALKMDSEAGKRVHYLMMKHGLDSISVLGDHLIRLFALGGCLYEANQVFWNVSKPSVFTWNAIISAHAKMGRGVRAFELYYKMQQVGIKPDTVTLLCLLKACSVMCALGQGRLIHNQAMRSGLESDITVGSSLVNMYTKCGVLEDAHKLFDSLPNRDIVSWGALIAGYASYGHGFPALELFKEMCKEGVKPNEVILLCVAKACSSIGTIKQGRLIHHEIIRNGSESVVTVANTLVDMYGNCGSLEEAQKVFHKLSNPDVVSWGAIIAGFARYGHYNLAVEYLDRMKRQGLNPDGMIFTSILNACSVAGLLEDAYRCLKSMLIDHGIAPSIEHYGCLIDLLGHKGRLQEAEDLLQTMPLSPNAAVWLSLLSSCKLHHNLKLGWQCFIRVAQMDPGDASGYMLMSNIYANAHLWEDASKVQEWRKSAGARKKGGKAWVEVNSQLHEFMVGGESHQESYYRISYKLKRSGLPLKEEGYVPFVDITIADDRVVDASCGRYGTC